MQKTISYIRAELSPLYPPSEIESFVFRILESACGMDRQSVLLGKDKQLSRNEISLIRKIVGELRKSRPIQYILGETEFFGLKIHVREGVLIPRPETEELIEAICTEIKGDEANRRTFRILDIGTGSGCIAIALATQFPGAIVTAIDISEEALEIAAENARLNRIAVNFSQADILHDEIAGEWDLIVSNPPYITPKEMDEMERNVLDYEPHLALFVPAEAPLLFYDRIASLGRKQLAKGGSLFFEINARFGEEVRLMLTDYGYSRVEIRKDISGRDRIVYARQ